VKATALGDAAIGNARGIIVSSAEEDFGGIAPFFERQADSHSERRL